MPHALSGGGPALDGALRGSVARSTSGALVCACLAIASSPDRSSAAEVAAIDQGGEVYACAGVVVAVADRDARPQVPMRIGAVRRLRVRSGAMVGGPDPRLTDSSHLLAGPTGSEFAPAFRCSGPFPFSLCARCRDSCGFSGPSWSSRQACDTSLALLQDSVQRGRFRRVDCQPPVAARVDHDPRESTRPVGGQPLRRIPRSL